jgi:hypothetical protein
MKGGDISNETPRRLIVNADVVGETDLYEKRRGLTGLLSRNKVWEEQKKRTPMRFDNRVLSHLWNFSSRNGLSVELVAFEDEQWAQADLDSIMERLDARGANPFNYAEVYPSLEDFVADLPYRPNLQGVVDLHNRAARYGSWYFSLNL